MWHSSFQRGRKCNTEEAHVGRHGWQKKLVEQFKQLSACISKLEEEVLKSSEAMADLSVRLKLAEKWAENVAYEKNGLQPCLQKSKRKQDGQRWSEKELGLYGMSS